LAVAGPLVVEGSSRGLGCGAYFNDWNPLPMSSDAPALQLDDVSWLLHVGTPRFLALNICAICGGITEVHTRALPYVTSHLLIGVPSFDFVISCLNPSRTFEKI